MRRKINHKAYGLMPRLERADVLYQQKLSDFEAKGLLTPAIFWLHGMDMEQQRLAVSGIGSAFDSFKVSVTDKNGMVLTTERANIFANPHGQLVRSDGIKPYQCAGWGVSNFIDLAFKLWTDDFEKFVDVCDEHGVPVIFSLTGVVFGGEAHLQSLLRLNRLLTRQLMERAHELNELAERHIGTVELHNRIVSGLAKGRHESARKRAERRESRDHQITTMASEYWKAHPAEKSVVVAQYLKESFRDLAVSTIEKKIKGVKAATLRSMDTDIPR